MKTESYEVTMERVQCGLKWLDYNHSFTPIQWRQKLRLTDVRFADRDKGILNQLIGSYNWKHWPMGPENFGFMTSFSTGNTANLRKAWEEVLHTDKFWTKNDVTQTWSRKYMGLDFYIFLDYDGKYTVRARLNKNKQYTKREFKNLDSAKRHVQKMWQKKEDN